MGVALTSAGPCQVSDKWVAERRLWRLYGVQTLDGFGQFAPAARAALGALVDYLDLTRGTGGNRQLKEPRRACKLTQLRAAIWN